MQITPLTDQEPPFSTPYPHQPPPQVLLLSKKKKPLPPTIIQPDKMGSKSPEITSADKPSKRITEIGMTPEAYHELSVHIKSIILPGTLALECSGPGGIESKIVYHQWFDNALEEIGPKFFPRGANGLVWPEDYAEYVFPSFTLLCSITGFSREAFVGAKICMT